MNTYILTLKDSRKVSVKADNRGQAVNRAMIATKCALSFILNCTLILTNQK